MSIKTYLGAALMMPVPFRPPLKRQIIIEKKDKLKMLSVQIVTALLRFLFDI